jgi:hypothetical protein
MRPYIEKPETQNQRLEPTGLAKPGKTIGLTGTGAGSARPDAAGRVFGWFGNQTEPFIWSKPGPLAGYPDPLLTLITASKCNSKVAQLLPPSSHKHGLHVHLQPRSIMASKSFSKLARVQPQCASLSSLEGESIWRDTRPWWTPHISWLYERLTTVREDPHKLRRSTKLGKSAWDQEVGKIECVFRKMRWCLSTPGSHKYILPVAESISGIPGSPYVYI